MAIEQATKTGASKDTISAAWNKYNATITALLTEHASTGAHGAITATSLATTTITALTSLTPAANLDIGAYSFRAENLIADALTSGRVVLTTTNGQLTSDGNITFSVDTLTVAKASIGAAGLTVGTTTPTATQWGYLGALTTHPLGADGTAGRILREIRLFIVNGTDDFTLKCKTVDRWNGDVLAEVDNIAKDATTGTYWTLSADGKDLTIECSGLSGNVVCAFPSLTLNASGTALTISAETYLNDILVRVMNATTGVKLDMTVLVDTGQINTEIFYITDA